MQGGISQNWHKNIKKNFYRKIRIMHHIGAYNNYTTRENSIDIFVVVEYIIGSGCATETRDARSRWSSMRGLHFFTL